ncbi:MAG TPA: hypothetical protein VFP33_01755 [Gallionella sp.]|nr:hypothetical protein [Gallionella sp.]
MKHGRSMFVCVIGMTVALFALLHMGSAQALSVSSTRLQVLIGNTVMLGVNDASGRVNAKSSNTDIATVSYEDGVARITGRAAGKVTVSFRDGLNTRTVAVTVTSVAPGNFTLLAWSNLGMHCYDGNGYSVFSILPPFSTLNAQLVDRSTGMLVASGVTMTYQSTPDTRGSINTISSTKTNFWQYVKILFGMAPPADVGLLGYPVASNSPAPMAYNAKYNWFEAVGIPMTNVDDANARNDYPMVRVVAKNSTGQVLATTRVVLPVSDMMDCHNCHASNTDGNAAQNRARPAAGWVFDPDPLSDWKKNILRLHDEKQAGKPAFAAALKAKGYPDGLYGSAMAGKPVLCPACHVSNVYRIDAGVQTGMEGLSPMTEAIHRSHANQTDPGNGMTLDHINDRSACYLCHPGSVTKCLRGAMAGSDHQCQDCHGRMSHVGRPSRKGWLDLPNCQACHHDGKRELVGVDSQGRPLSWGDGHFATSPDVPTAGARLYRFSDGHGGLKCPACHGSTHAESPSREDNDNVQNIAIQGYAGPVLECAACHASMPNTVNGGPHGMHPTGSQWFKRHGEVSRSAAARTGCAYCHGKDFRGSPLSRVKVPRSIGSHSYAAGQAVGCYECHNGPTSGSRKSGA